MEPPEERPHSPGRRPRATATRRQRRPPPGNVGRPDRRRRPGRPGSRAERPGPGCPRWPRPDRVRSRGRRRDAAPTGSAPENPSRGCRGRAGTPASPRPRGQSPSAPVRTRGGPGPGRPRQPLHAQWGRAGPDNVDDVEDPVPIAPEQHAGREIRIVAPHLLARGEIPEPAEPESRRKSSQVDEVSREPFPLEQATLGLELPVAVSQLLANCGRKLPQRLVVGDEVQVRIVLEHRGDVDASGSTPLQDEPAVHPLRTRSMRVRCGPHSKGELRPRLVPKSREQQPVGVLLDLGHLVDPDELVLAPLERKLVGDRGRIVW